MPKLDLAPGGAPAALAEQFEVGYVNEDGQQRLPLTAIHRRGGDAMLHHRSLNPVVIRDWSHKMELFAGALDISASVSFEARRTINGAEHHTTEYLRPAPASSPFLDTAVEPVPWPRRDGPRPPTGARPWLPHEKPKPFYGRGPLRSTSQR